MKPLAAPKAPSALAPHDPMPARLLIIWMALLHVAICLLVLMSQPILNLYWPIRDSIAILLVGGLGSGFAGWMLARLTQK
ncbi:hypothetical protein SAMN05421823_11224 [Catalinimonas alkaloidigena]|uniref:Uncharacterized protein n=1 Tax=Catalinimonas alkaloidigena TaxID=1075417 RepID=A0A1G9S699_9BACT|nr:hypothetical protein [Catalinimonas alkaloidigena]SDM30285.1 hypothetical protein SAMN05421823_11224 [Catalinimonas alkaloidigena]